MKKLTLILLLLAGFTLTKAQKKINVYANSKGRPYVYGFYDTRTGVIPALTVDSSTKWIETTRQNQLPNQALNAYVFVSGTKKVNLLAHILRGDIRNYRYNIIQDDSIYLATNAIPVNISKTPEDGNRLKIDFGNYNVENKKLTLEIYDITNPTKASTLTIL